MKRKYNRRYYLHRQLRQQCDLRILAQQYTISMPVGKCLNDKARYYLNLLKLEYNYVIQLEIPH